MWPVSMCDGCGQSVCVMGVVSGWIMGVVSRCVMGVVSRRVASGSCLWAGSVVVVNISSGCGQ